MVFKLFESLEDFLDESANLIYKIYEESITISDRFSLMLSGGTPLNHYLKKLLKITKIKSIGKKFLSFGQMKDTLTKKMMIVIINGRINCYFPR
jgi:hypothetical protein